MAYYRIEEMGVAVYDKGNKLVKICRELQDARILCGTLKKNEGESK